MSNVDENKINEEANLEIAANSDPNTIMPSLFQLIQTRASYARLYLKMRSKQQRDELVVEEAYREVKSAYDYSNEQIKKLLGLL